MSPRRQDGHSTRLRRHGQRPGKTTHIVDNILLAEELPAIYTEQAGAVVVFVSAEYADRAWTRLERRAAVNRAVRERRE